jgi:hypothetical protein
MCRFGSLIAELNKSFQDDWWLKEYQSVIDSNFDGLLRAQVSIYDTALCSLDENACVTLKKKITPLFKQNSGRRGKHQFFNQLNEALAYKYLIDRGCTNIMFLPERSREGLKTADLSFEEKASAGLCEVKTINISEEEHDRFEAEEVFAASVYRELDEGFFKKLRSDIDNALEKMQEPVEKKLVFFVIHFDDMAHYFFQTHKKQITRCLGEEYPSTEIYIRVGLNTNMRIHHVPKSA